MEILHKLDQFVCLVFLVVAPMRDVLQEPLLLSKSPNLQAHVRGWARDGDVDAVVRISLIFTIIVQSCNSSKCYNIGGVTDSCLISAYNCTTRKVTGQMIPIYEILNFLVRLSSFFNHINNN